MSEGQGWDEIHGFASAGEYRRFLGWLDDALAEGALVEVPVRSRYAGEMLDERWFREATGRCWRFVAPDPPFTGVFLTV